MEITKELILSHHVQMLKERSSSFQDHRESVASFTEQGIGVRLVFAEGGKSFDDLLINYFKNLKQS